jgi:hypothetical protein
VYVLGTKPNTTDLPGDEEVVIKTRAEQNKRVGTRCRKVSNFNTGMDPDTEVLYVRGKPWIE